MTMKTLTRLLAVPAVLATLAITGSAFAGSGGGGGGHRGGHGAPLGRVVQQLDLTPDQEAIVDAAKEEAKADREATKAQMESIHASLQAELSSANPNKDTIYSLMEQKSALRLSKEKSRVETFLELQATFTPEQQAELERIMAEGQERRDAKRAEHGASGGERGGRGHGDLKKSERGGGKHKHGGRRGPRNAR